jgi:hypothetical protein
MTQGARSAAPLAALVLAAFALACAALAVHLGQTAHWDLRNYHLYNAWAFWHDRAALDVIPAQLQSHFNPLLHLFTHALYQALAPWQSAAVLGLLQGLNAVPLYFIARRLLPDAWRGKHDGCALACALVGACSATQISQLGASSGDNMVSLPLLAALALTLPRAQPHRWAMPVAGALLGAAAGLKLTAAPMALGVLLAVTLVRAPYESRAHRSLMPTIGAVLGFAVTAGWWHALLWQRTGNPLFPFFGSVFDSAQIPPFPLRDLRFVAHTAWDALFRPWIGTADWRVASELRFRDLRLPLLWCVLLLWPWWSARWRARIDAPLRTALLALVLGYAGWVVLFGIHRYVAAWEMLAPILCVALLARCWPSVRLSRVALALMLMTLVPSTNPPNWDRVPFGAQFLSVQWPRTFDAEDLIVSAQDEPLGYLATTLPQTTGWVSVSSNMHGRDYPVYALDHRVAQRLDAHAGRLWLVRRAVAPQRIAYVLGRYGLTLREGSCAPIRSNLEPTIVAALELCALDRSRSAREALARDDR